MIPFPIISNTRIIPVLDIVKFDTNAGSMYILYSDGKFYGRGRNAAYQMGTGTNANVNDWFLISSDVSYFWISHDSNDNSVIVRKTDDTWNVVGRAYIFGDTSTIYNTITNVDSKLSELNNGYDEIILNFQNIWFKRNGSYYRMGINGNYNLLTGNTTALTTFTQYVDSTGTVKNIYPTLLGTIVTYLDGSTKSIGNNATARLGLPARQAYTSLTTIPITNVQNIYFGQASTFFNTSTALYATGQCTSGQLGNGVSDPGIYILAPTQVYSTPIYKLIPSDGSTLMCTSNSASSFMVAGATGRVGITTPTTSSTFIPATKVQSTDFYLNDSASYYILNNKLYGVGQPGIYNLLPGYTGTLTDYKLLEIP